MDNEKQVKENYKSINIKLRYLPWVFILDQAIRICILFVYISGVFGNWQFILIQILLLIVIGIRYGAYSTKIENKYKAFINPNYSGQDIRISIDDNVPNGLTIFMALLGFIFSFWFFYHIFSNHRWYMYVLFFYLGVGGAFLFAMSSVFTIYLKESSGILGFKVNEITTLIGSDKKEETISNDVSKNFQDIIIKEKLNINSEEIIELDSVDYNDTRIAKLESELKNINHRVEAWMLESVFLGGLAFSGFLTVAAANFLENKSVAFNEFITHITSFANDCLTKSFYLWLHEIQNHFHRPDLNILIMLLCLMSSVFFLLVLTLRLRLNSLSLNMDHLIRIMTVFNAKEDELFNIQQEDVKRHQETRLTKISKKIDVAISDAEKLLKELRPTVMMMSIYRNLAVFLFFMVLIVSGFYFMPVVSFLILSLAIFTQVFRLVETYSKLERIKRLIRKH